MQNQIQSKRKNLEKHIVNDTTPKNQRLKVWLQTKGRRGKMVTIIQGFEMSANTLNQLARQLKQHCGAGGTVKGQEIEIQGDKRSQVIDKLAVLGFGIKK